MVFSFVPSFKKKFTLLKFNFDRETLWESWASFTILDSKRCKNFHSCEGTVVSPMLAGTGGITKQCYRWKVTSLITHMVLDFLCVNVGSVDKWRQSRNDAIRNDIRKLIKNFKWRHHAQGVLILAVKSRRLFVSSCLTQFAQHYKRVSRAWNFFFIVYDFMLE